MTHAILAAVLLIAAAWGLSRPVPECPDRADQTASLSCEVAVATALGVLPDERAAIARIQFLYGSRVPYFPALAGPGEQATIGFVQFTYEDGWREYVDVAAFRGEVSAAAPMPYPLSSASQARP